MEIYGVDRGIVILASCEHPFIRVRENLVQHPKYYTSIVELSQELITGKEKNIAEYLTKILYILYRYCLQRYQRYSYVHPVKVTSMNKNTKNWDNVDIKQQSRPIIGKNVYRF